MSDTVELVIDAKAELGEGALWDAKAQRLYWLDIIRGEVHIYDPAAQTDRCIHVGEMVGTVVPRASGGLMLAVERGFASLDLNTEQLALVAAPEPRRPDLRFNDGKCDPAGRFWAGTMGKHAIVPGVGTLYCLDAEHGVWPKVGNADCPNGIVWTADRRTMYWVDYAKDTVYGFDYDDASGEISHQRVAISFDRAKYGGPDGMTIDAEGHLWIAGWGGHCVTCWDVNRGVCLHVLEVPASQVTSCAFGGPNLDALYITSARTGLDEATLAAQPLAGGLFVCHPGATGVPAFEYAG
jgi:sugar lactone lactonase YvrE